MTGGQGAPRKDRGKRSSSQGQEKKGGTIANGEETIYGLAKGVTRHHCLNYKLPDRGINAPFQQTTLP